MEDRLQTHAPWLSPCVFAIYNPLVIRSPTFLRSMTRLALVAVLLLAFAPSVSRVLAGGATQILAGWTELCTTQGLKWVDTGAQSMAEKSPVPSPMPMGSDCAYCPLAASLPLLLLFFVLLFPRLADGSIAPIHRPPPPRVIINLRGLGSRGPPVLF